MQFLKPGTVAKPDASNKRQSYTMSPFAAETMSFITANDKSVELYGNEQIIIESKIQYQKIHPSRAAFIQATFGTYFLIIRRIRGFRNAMEQY